MEYIVVLHPRRKGPFRRNIEGQRAEFHAKQAVQLTEKQFVSVVSDLGSALVLVDEWKETRRDQEIVSYVPNWLRTKIMACESAEKKIELAEKNGTNPGELMSPFERNCWERRDEIAEDNLHEAGKPEFVGELSEFLDLSNESVQFLIDHGLPIGETKFDTGAVNDWMKSKEGTPLFEEARKMTAQSSDDDNGGQQEPDDDDQDDDEYEEMVPVELSSQAKVAEHFAVSVDDVKAWVKDGLKKEGKVYMSSDIYDWLKENQKLGDEVSENFENALDLEIFRTSIDGKESFKIFTNFGALINEKDLNSEGDVTGVLVEIASELPEVGFGTVIE